MLNGVPMTCQEFLARHSEFLDGELEPDDSARMQAHLATCPSCARYDRVVRGGLRLVRSLPEVEPSPDFFPRLQHRIYNLEDGVMAGCRPSGVGALVSLAVAGSLAVLAWSPLLRMGPVSSGEEPRAVAQMPSQGAGADQTTPAAAPGRGAAGGPASTAPAVQLAAEEEGLPSIDPRSAVRGGATLAGSPGRAPSGWWWPGTIPSVAVPTATGVTSTYRTAYMVDIRVPGPYSPIIIEAPAFRRATTFKCAEGARCGRD